mmetsp:Transcript_13191/g.53249  ORF Transcript_13191/g.53249 Transcript_13191/m.53249 type:complete len:683 (-) Transcript_13191:14-2062(-)
MYRAFTPRPSRRVRGGPTAIVRLVCVVIVSALACDAAPFTSKFELQSAVYSCLGIRSYSYTSFPIWGSDSCCNSGANCGPAGTDEMDKWDVSQVTDMTALFKDTIYLPLNISAWDVSSVTGMSQMFYRDPYSISYVSPGPVPDISGWNISQVTNMNHMFYGQKQFNGNLSSWNVGKVTDFRGMFRGCSAFNGDLSNWDVSQATDMGLMFESAYKFNRDISDWDVSSVTKMDDMFHRANAFNQDLSKWDVSSVTDMYRMFAYSVFDGADGEIVGSTWTTAQVTNAQDMFIGNTAWTAKYEIISGTDPDDGPPSRWGKKSCPVNYYVKSNMCAPCPAGTNNAAGDDPYGVDTSCDPIICAQNERVQSNACVACAEGAVRPAGDEASGPDTSCACPENYHVCKLGYDAQSWPSWVSGTDSCKACPPGTTRAAGDDPASTATTCDYTPCAENEFVADRTEWNLWSTDSSYCPGSTPSTLGDIHKFECKACPGNLVNAAGDDPAAFSSAGYCTCPINTYGEIWTEKCTACPDGTANAAGDKAGYTWGGIGISACRPITCAENERLQNNTCVSKLCGAYERVQNNTCVACPPGTVNAPGDDPAGADTLCDARGCPLDHHVVNKTCVKCGEGLTNLAGDDESGDDTECRGYGSGAGDVYGERSLFTAVAVALVTAILDNRRWENNIPLS